MEHIRELVCIALVVCSLQDTAYGDHTSSGWDSSGSGSGWDESGSSSGWDSSGSGSGWDSSGSGSGWDDSGSGSWWDGSGSGWFDSGSGSGWFDQNGVWHPYDDGDSSEDKDDHHGVQKGVIIGAFVLGGLLIMAVILATTIYCIIQNNHKKTRISQDQHLTTTLNLPSVPVPAYPRQPHIESPPAYETLSAVQLGKQPDYDTTYHNRPADVPTSRPPGQLPPMQHGHVHQNLQPGYGPGSNMAPLPPIVRNFEASAPSLYN